MAVPVTFGRADWDNISEMFERFFELIGEVTIDAESLRFSAEHSGVSTGFELYSNGTSAAFMRLHSMRSRWEEVTFDPENAEVSVWGDGVSYTYRVPPSMLPDSP